MTANLGSSVPVPVHIRAAFAPALMSWQRSHGRHGLPWQGTRDTYRVWLSEVMLQQTQVSTVLSYYPRFLDRFPDVRSLAAASADDVMAMWSGLGYYSRARNLHRCAQVVVSDHQGEFPRSAAALEQLPGIGASTAAAIAAFCHGEPVSIADGNVRRVLSRLLAIEDDLSTVAAQRRLWDVAQALVPVGPALADMQAYTQGLMDLGATVCSRSRPGCSRCPVASLCVGLRNGDPERYPVRSRRLVRRHESWFLLVLMREHAGERQVWLQRRPAKGIWGGLYCVPVFPSESDALAELPLPLPEVQPLPVLCHALTHRELRLHPLLVTDERVLEVQGDGTWHPMATLDTVGIPAPLKALLLDL